MTAAPPPVAARLRPRHGLAAAEMAVALGIVAALVLVTTLASMPGGLTAQFAPVAEAVPCPGTTVVHFGSSTYTSCDATIDWSSAGQGANWTMPTNTTRITLDGVTFAVFGYATEECPVVNVTGQEAVGSAYSLLIYPSPMNCNFVVPTVFAPDGEFGASWTGGSAVELLVRSSFAPALLPAP